MSIGRAPFLVRFYRRITFFLCFSKCRATAQKRAGRVKEEKNGQKSPGTEHKVFDFGKIGWRN
jgi:hypothetical protein